jgi:hypothetical protein
MRFVRIWTVPESHVAGLAIAIALNPVREGVYRRGFRCDEQLIQEYQIVCENRDLAKLPCLLTPIVQLR